MPQALSSRTPPVGRIRRALEARLEKETLGRLPNKYERLGDVLVLPSLDVPRAWQEEVAAAYARELGMRTVLVRTGGVEGAMRRPAVRHVWGDVDSTTTITQHGIKYRCDPARVMFSAGNLEERRRMAGLPAAGETVVDLFAGLGYLSLPLAVHAGPRRVVACEINPEAAAFLQQNVALNGVADRFEVRQGDNRLVAPRGVADRVLMGYLHDTWSWLPLADEVLKPEGGVIHYHFKAPDEQWPSKVLAQVQEHLGGRPTRLLGFQRVKPYAPRVLHGVLDVEVGPR